MSEKTMIDVSVEREVIFGDVPAPMAKEGVKFAAPSDPVEHPAHYQQFGMEVIDIIRHVLGPEGFRAYCIGNELKYRLRAGDKGDATQDMAKAMKYREFREGK
ncbi:MAG: DUF3310 domain-containing protein [Clostridia bacterium]|nr:DUF3310 domain-containing protein [Clostridia bacterium]